MTERETYTLIIFERLQQHLLFISTEAQLFSPPFIQ